jgi:hypothetical protein
MVSGKEACDRSDVFIPTRRASSDVALAQHQNAPASQSAMPRAGRCRSRSPVRRANVVRPSRFQYRCERSGPIDPWASFARPAATPIGRWSRSRRDTIVPISTGSLWCSGLRRASRTSHTIKMSNMLRSSYSEKLRLTSRDNLFGLAEIRRMGKSSVLRVFLDVTYLRLRMTAERRRGL